MRLRVLRIPAVTEPGAELRFISWFRVGDNQQTVNCNKAY